MTTWEAEGGGGGGGGGERGGGGGGEESDERVGRRGSGGRGTLYVYMCITSVPQCIIMVYMYVQCTAIM